MLRQGFYQRKVLFGRSLANALHHLAVVDGVRYIVRFAGAAVRQADFQVDADGLRDFPLPS